MTAGTINSPLGNNTPKFFNGATPTPFSPLASPQLANPSPSHSLVAAPKTPKTYDPMTHGGCTLNVDESDTFPFCHMPFLFQYKGETHCSLTVELPNCTEDIRMSVLPSQREALLEFDISNKMMKQQAIFFSTNIQAGSVLFEAVEKWRRGGGRSHDKEKFQAKIKVKLPLKVEFETCSSLPGTRNQTLVQRHNGEMVLSTVSFFFKECNSSFAVGRKVKEAELFICDIASDSE